MDIIGNSFLKKLSEFLLEKKITVFIIFILSLIIFSINIGHEQLWYDEALSLHFSQLNFPNLLSQIGFNGAEANPPFFHIIIKGMRFLFGENIIAFRFLSALFSSLLAVSVYLFTLELFNRKTALLSVILLCLNPVIIGFSQEIRMYTLATLLCFLNLSSFYLFLHNRKKIFLIVYVITGVAGLYTQYYFIFTTIITFVTFVLYSVHENRLNIKLFMLYAGVNIFFLLTFAPWVPAMFNQIENISLAKWTESIDGDTLFKVFGYFFSSKFSHDVHPFIPFHIFSYFAFFFSGFAIYLSFRKKFFNLKIWFLLSGFLIPILFSFIYSVFFPSIINFRYFILFVPFYFILIAYGISRFAKGKKSFLIILVYLILIAPSIYIVYSDNFNGSPKTMAEFLNHNKKKNEKILTFDSSSFLTLNYYLLNPADLYFYSENTLPACYGTNLFSNRYVTQKEIKSVLSTNTSHWIVYTPWTKSIIPTFITTENLSIDTAILPKVFEYKWSWQRFKAEHVYLK